MKGCDPKLSCAVGRRRGAVVMFLRIVVSGKWRKLARAPGN